MYKGILLIESRFDIHYWAYIYVFFYILTFTCLNIINYFIFTLFTNQNWLSFANKSCNKLLYVV